MRKQEVGEEGVSEQEATFRRRIKMGIALVVAYLALVAVVSLLMLWSMGR